MSWGRGLTPTFKEQSCNLLAIAWDQVVQLVRLESVGVNQLT